MPRRISLYLADEARRVIGDTPEPSLSGRVNTILVRYGEITTRDCPALTEAEWCFLADVLNGIWLQAEHGSTDPARYVRAEAADAEPEIAEKWGIDQRALVERLRALPYSATCAIVEVVARFWAATGRPDQPETVTEQLRAAGARLEV